MAGMSIPEFQEKHPNWSEMVTDGANGLLFEILGFENQFGGDTASILAGMDDNFAVDTVKALSNLVLGNFPDQDLGRIAFGPFGNTMKRTGDFMSGTYNSIASFWATPTGDVAVENAVKFVQDFAKIVSSYNNFEKGRLLYRLGEVHSNSDNVILDKNDTKNLSIQTILAKAMGFPLDIEQAYWKLSLDNRDRNNDIAKSKRIIKEAAVEARKTGNDARFEAIKYWALKGFSALEQAEIKEAIAQDVLSDTIHSELDKEVQRYLMQLIRGQGRIGAGPETAIIQDNKKED
jgi:hypothetical protein